MKHCPYQAIWFDLDGTLFDTANDIINAVQKTLHEHHYPSADPKILKRRINYGARSMIAEVFGCDTSDERFNTLMETYAKHYSQALSKTTKWFPGMENIINEIEQQGIAWGIITNKAEQFTVPLIEELGLTHRIVALVGGDTTSESKPSARPLLYACEKTGYNPQNCLFAGDNSTDIIAGNAAGMTTVACAYGYTPSGERADQWGADYVIDHPTGFHKILWPNQ